jgi:cleavage and polyadenylation specificity factor subunit 3
VRSLASPAAPPPAAAGEGGGGGGGAAGQTQQQEEAVSVGDVVAVRYRRGQPAAGIDTHVVLEWAGGSKGDVVADAVLAVLLQTAGEPCGAALAEQRRQEALAAGDAKAALAAEVRLAAVLLEAQFGPVVVDEAAGTICWQVDGVAVTVHHAVGKVSCGCPVLRERLERVMTRIAEALKPCALDFED